MPSINDLPPPPSRSRSIDDLPAPGVIEQEDFAPSGPSQSESALRQFASGRVFGFKHADDFVIFLCVRQINLFVDRVIAGKQQVRQVGGNYTNSRTGFNFAGSQKMTNAVKVKVVKATIVEVQPLGSGKPRPHLTWTWSQTRRSIATAASVRSAWIAAQPAPSSRRTSSMRDVASHT